MNCFFCSTELPSFGYINGNHWDGEKYVRVDACSGCYQGTGGKCFAKRPRQPRKPRPQVDRLPATDWNYLVAFHNGRKRG